MKSADEHSYIALFRAIMFAQNDLQRMASDVAARYGLIDAELNVIDILGKFGATTMGTLSHRTFISPSNTTRTVKLLEKRGLVRRSRDRDSERVVRVALTARGSALFRRCYPAILGEAIRHFDKGLSRADRLRLVALLERLVPPMDY